MSSYQLDGRRDGQPTREWKDDADEWLCVCVMMMMMMMVMVK